MGEGDVEGQQGAGVVHDGMEDEGVSSQRCSTRMCMGVSRVREVEVVCVHAGSGPDARPLTPDEERPQRARKAPRLWAD